jgi:hypothetical protein
MVLADRARLALVAIDAASIGGLIPEAVMNLISNRPVGMSVRLSVEREGTALSITGTLGEHR